MKKFFISLVALSTLSLLSSCVSTPKRTITFDTKGGTEVDSISGVSGSKITQNISTTKEGYVFKGWYTKEDYTSTKVELSTYPYANVTLYAKWAKEITVNFVTNFTDVTKESLTEVEGNIVNLGENPTQTNYYFDGWYLDSDFSTPFNLVEYGVDDLTLYAKWSKYPTLYFETGIEGVIIPEITKAKGDTLDPIDSNWIPEDQTRKFVGWFIKDTDTQFYFTKMPDENTTIVAKWSYLRTITFNSEGGSNVVDIVAFSGESISAPIAPTKANYYLGGWYTDLSDDSTKFSFDVMPDSDITLYAKWIDNPVVSYYDAYDKNNPILLSSDSKMPGTKITTDGINHGNHSSDNALFLGWYTKETDSSGNDIYVKFVENTLISKENLNLYALWQEQIVVNFEGAKTNQQSYDLTDGSTILTSPELADDSKWLVGWYEQIDSTTNKPVGNPISFPFTSDKSLTLYPYVVNKVTISFVIGDSTYDLIGGESLKINLTDDIQNAIETYKTANSIKNYEWKIVENNIETSTVFDPKVFHDSNVVVKLVNKDTGFNPDIEL